MATQIFDIFLSQVFLPVNQHVNQAAMTNKLISNHNITDSSTMCDDHDTVLKSPRNSSMKDWIQKSRR